MHNFFYDGKCIFLITDVNGESYKIIKKNN